MSKKIVIKVIKKAVKPSVSSMTKKLFIKLLK